MLPPIVGRRLVRLRGSPTRPDNPQPLERVVGRLYNTLSILLIRLEETGLKTIEQGIVEPIEPDHRFVGVVPMIMPGPAGRQDEIARRHFESFTVHRGIRSLPRDNEAN